MKAVWFGTDAKKMGEKTQRTYGRTGGAVVVPAEVANHELDRKSVV